MVTSFGISTDYRAKATIDCYSRIPSPGIKGALFTGVGYLGAVLGISRDFK